MSVLPAARPIQGFMHQRDQRGMKGGGLQDGKRALAGPHPLSERAVKSCWSRCRGLVAGFFLSLPLT